MFRKLKLRRRDRCPNLSPSPHPAYARKQCNLERNHGGLCQIRLGAYRHYWNQSSYEKLGKALVKGG